MLFVLNSLVGGGAERVVIHLLNNLDRTKYDFRLVIFKDIRDYQKNITGSLPILCLNKKGRWDFLKLVFRLRKVIKEYEPDYILSALMYENIISVLAGFGLKKKFKIILSEHIFTENILAYEKFRGLKKILINFTYNKADKIIAVSRDIKKCLVDKFNVPSGKIDIIYNPIPLDEIRREMLAQAECEFFKESGNFIIIGAGRLVRAKRFDILMNAFSMVIKEEKRARLIILGKGDLLEELKTQAEKLKIDDKIFFAGFQPNPYAWFFKADMFVLSSDCEGFPMVILESMACGTPVISSDCFSGPGEIITNGENGMLTPAGDAGLLAKVMLTLIRDEELRKKLSYHGEKRAEDFRMEKIISQYEALFS